MSKYVVVTLKGKRHWLGREHIGGVVALLAEFNSEFECKRAVTALNKEIALSSKATLKRVS